MEDSVRCQIHASHTSSSGVTNEWAGCVLRPPSNIFGAGGVLTNKGKIENGERKRKRER